MITIKKLLVSAIIAFIVLSLICFFYYNIPTHSKSKDGVTDYVWENNKFYIDATEGFSFGKTNNEGYFNEKDYVGQDIDVLIMGSSHMQGMAVMPKDNIASILEKQTDLTVYNIGTTGHNIKVCVSNLDAALNKYKPNIVVIETNNVTLSSKEVDAIINDETKELDSIEGGIVGFLQNNPFIRWSYTQIESLIQNSNKTETNKENSIFDKDASNKLVKYIKEISNKYNTEVIMLYHPVVSINNDGMKVIEDKDAMSSFNNICEENGIYFVDMTNRYLQEYKDNSTVPTGFINTGVASGHINKYGHEMMADELCKIIEVIHK